MLDLQMTGLKEPVIFFFSLTIIKAGLIIIT